MEAEASHATLLRADSLTPVEAATRTSGRPSNDVRRYGVGSEMGHRRLWSAEDRVEIVLQSLRGQESNVSICRRYHISEPTLYKWRNLFIEGGRAFLSGSGPPVVKGLIEENRALKDMVAELSMAYRRLRATRAKPTAQSKATKAAVPRAATRSR